MRISLAGPIVRRDPIVLIFDTPGSFSFDKTLYSGYTHYDAIAIGAGGGKGADLVSGGIKGFGGEGGGGGFHRRQGLLEILDNTITIVVGAHGAPGSTASDGEDGETSYFGSIVRATGGFGGKHCTSVATDFPNPGGNGGDGGIGGISDIVTYLGTRYAGALGGVAGAYDPESFGHHMQPTYGMTGNLVVGPVKVGQSLTYTDDGLIGLGGGGGAGGLQSSFPLASAGGKGSYNSEESVFSPGGSPDIYVVAPDSSYLIIPGKAGGARITPLNGSKISYGDSGKDGVVAIRLTAE